MILLIIILIKYTFMTSISKVYYERDTEMNLDLYKLIDYHLSKLNYMKRKISMNIKEFSINQRMIKIKFIID